MPKKKKVRVKAKQEPPKEGIRSFEDSLHELEEIVVELESGKLSLADSLEKYEAGIKNLKTCHRILESAENKIRLLTGGDSDGNPVTQEFEGQETELHGRSNQRSMDSSETLVDITGSDFDGGDGEGIDDVEESDDEDDVVDGSGSLF